jgi:hypothetical protein
VQAIGEPAVGPVACTRSLALATWRRPSRAGQFFGEVGLLGLNWRTASVIARPPMRLLVLAPREFSSLLHVAPAVAERVRDAARERT